MRNFRFAVREINQGADSREIFRDLGHKNNVTRSLPSRVARICSHRKIFKYLICVFCRHFRRYFLRCGRRPRGRRVHGQVPGHSVHRSGTLGGHGGGQCGHEEIREETTRHSFRGGNDAVHDSLGSASLLHR